MESSPFREKVRELSTVSRDIELLTRQVGAAQFTMQVGFLNDRIEALTVQQRKLVVEIAAQCTDEALRSEFEDLDRRLESVRAQVKDCKAPERLEELRETIEPLVERWADLFQRLVVATLDKPAPASASQGE